MCSKLGVFVNIQAAVAVPVSDEKLAKAVTQSVALVPTHGLICLLNFNPP